MSYCSPKLRVKKPDVHNAYLTKKQLHRFRSRRNCCVATPSRASSSARICDIVRSALMSPRLSALRNHGSKSPPSQAALPHKETHLPKCRLQRMFRKARLALVHVRPPISHRPVHREPAISRGQSRNHDPYYRNRQVQQQCRKQALDLFPDPKMPSTYAVVWDVVGASML
jgi:hypothetical protein